nr:Chain E, PEPTIDE1 [Escherichia coli BL21]4C2D_F Chain F, PEPTIDE1 [Escherichia coli BL21]4C2D_G Chain G, PEPTIDE1 [Escherichia coli BL21]4C2D_H Chain H, PEPTIDE1 [Escherichia coli BL21]
AASLSA